MSERSQHRTTPLVWLRPEIDRSIESARGLLAEAVLRRADRAGLLTEARADARRVRGALNLLCLDGAARFCQSLEETLAAFMHHDGLFTELNVSVADRSMFALAQFLADVAQGEPDMPLKLFPVYRELAELSGRTACSEVELFFPDLAPVPPPDPRAMPVPPGMLSAHLAACSTLFQRGLLSWLKDGTRLAGIGMMRSAVDAMQRTASQTRVHPGLWWAAGAMIDALAQVGGRIDPAATRTTLGRLERAMRAVASGAEVDSALLLREVLYPVALADPVGERVQAVKALYRLDAEIPDFCVSGTLEYDTSALQPLIEAMRRRLDRIEEAWSRYAAGIPASLPELREELQALKGSARDLGHYRLVRLLDIVMMIASRLSDADTARNEALSLEMAAAFLFMEGMLEHFTDPPPDIDQQVTVMAGSLLDAVKPAAHRRTMPGTARDDITQRQHVADIRVQVVCEIQENLLRVEEIVEQAVREPAASARLGATERPLAQVAGALKMLGLNRASSVLASCTQLLKACATVQGRWKLGTLQWAADGLCCLGFYLDALRRGVQPNEELLADFVRRMASANEAPAGSTGWIPAEDVAAEAAAPQAPADVPGEPAAAESAPDAAHATIEPALPGGGGAAAPASPAAVPVADRTADTTSTPKETAHGGPGRALRGHAEPDAGAPSDDPDASLLPVFLGEARLLLGRLYSEFAAWRSAPHEIRAARAFARTLHTLKGSARLVGAMRLGDFTHGVESYVGDAIEAGSRTSFDFVPLQQMLASIAEQIAALSGASEPGRGVTEGARPPAASHSAADPIILDAPSTVRVPVSTLTGLVNHAGELSEVRARTEDEMGTLRRSLHELAETVSRLRGQLRETEKEAERRMQAADADASARPEDERSTRLQELTRAMAESLYDVQTLQQSLVINCAETEAALALQGRLDRNLRHRLLELRSLPFGSLAERLRRTVRQTASQLDREAELAIEGDTVAIDRIVLQRLAAPLEHMLRNAVAHGIEPVPVRVTTGKPPAGTIRLVIEQSEDENVLTLSDDGAGLDLEQIRAQAVNLGLVSADEHVSDRMLCRLIFAPGLTTASKLTAASGRGVGLDVVRAEVRALGGSIEVSSERGAGACFRIRFPTSLSYTQALLVRAADRPYAIPATLVEQVCELPADALLEARERGVVSWHGQEYRYADLGRLLGAAEPPGAPRRANSVLLLHGEGERTALHVEQVLRKQAIELKNIGPQLARVRGIAGATILGKGEVVLILDPDELLMHATHRLAREARTPAGGRDSPHVVLVVDDSLTMRRVTSRLLARAGYRVLVARDGVDALQQIEETMPDLVIADIEMPNMDGFELTSHLRSDPRTDRVPIIIVTSRVAEKHQRRASDLGVDVFFGKPYAEERLLADVAELLDRRAREAAA